MKALFLITLTFLLIILQSTVFPYFSWFDQCFDLLIIDILFLSLIASRHSMIFAIIAVGCAMDSISGVPFYYHVFSYLWIYIMVNIVRQLFFDQRVLFILIISFISVIIQHVLLLFSIFINNGNDFSLEFDFNLLIKQTLWGFIFIPLSIWIINIFWLRWKYMTKLMRKRLIQKQKG
jgi:rod shape-determining protein MreD